MREEIEQVAVVRMMAAGATILAVQMDDLSDETSWPTGVEKSAKHPPIDMLSKEYSKLEDRWDKETYAFPNDAPGAWLGLL